MNTTQPYSWITGIVISGFCILKLWLVAILPYFVPMYGTHDSTWFYLKAISIQSGQWMGEVFDHFTLIKGPVFPFFLSMLSEAGLSPKLVSDTTYILACVIFYMALRNCRVSRIWALLGFVLVLFNPVTSSELVTIPLRLSLYMPLMIIYLACVVVMIHQLANMESQLTWRWSLGAALTLGIAWHTREESIWMIPALIPVVFLVIRRLISSGMNLRLFLVWIPFFLVPGVLSHLIVEKNIEAYNFDGRIEFLSPGFARVQNAIYSLNTGEDEDFEYLNAEVRDKMKAISENTRNVIQPLLDTKGEYKSIGKSVRGDFAAWAIRDAVALLGHYESPSKAEAFYNLLADDIEEYCAQNDGNCRTMYLPGMLIKQTSLRAAPKNLVNSFVSLVTFENYNPADITGKYILLDSAFRYSVARTFGVHTGFVPEDETLLPRLDSIDIRYQILKSLHSIYQKGFWLLVLAGFLVYLKLVFKKKIDESQMAAISLSFGFAACFGIYLIVTTFVLPGFLRLLSVSTVPLLCLVAYVLAITLSSLTSDHRNPL